MWNVARSAGWGLAQPLLTWEQRANLHVGGHGEGLRSADCAVLLQNVSNNVEPRFFADLTKASEKFLSQIFRRPSGPSRSERRTSKRRNPPAISKDQFLIVLF